MKYIRQFSSTAERNALLATIDYNILQYTEGVGVGIAEGTCIGDSEPFYVENITNENETLNIVKSKNDAPALEIEYSTNKTTWQTLGTTSTTALTYTLQAGDKVYLRCSTNKWTSSTRRNTITGVSKVGGNIMSLLYGSNFTGQETNFPSESTYNFCYLFYDNTRLIDASNLLLPATTLTSNCYASMFLGCTSLTSIPALPATTLANYCYSSMFNGCTSLTSVPALPATTLVTGCYNCMFSNCGNLNYIKCLATDISASNCTTNWTSGVAASGTFVKDTSMSSWTTGADGIPNGWTVEDAA